MAFSPTRNTFSILGKRRKRKEYNKPTFKSQKSIENLQIVDGIRGACLLIICFGITFYLTQYAIVGNVDDLQKLKQSFLFN